MANKQQMQDTLERLSYWATIENYRWWLAHDQVYLQLIRHRKTMSADTVRTIAKAYGINRNIKAGDGNSDKTASDIADVLNSTPFSDFEKCATLSEKFVALRRILRRMPMNVGRDDDKLTFVSGTSKLVWFFAPRGWTLFDSLAAHGAKITRNLASIERANRFYTALTDRGFEHTIVNAQKVFSNSSFNTQSSERLADKYLWLAGCDPKDRYDAILMLEFYMNGLPPDMKAQLNSLATEVEDTCDADLRALTRN